MESDSESSSDASPPPDVASIGLSGPHRRAIDLFQEQWNETRDLKLRKAICTEALVSLMNMTPRPPKKRLEIVGHSLC